MDTINLCLVLCKLLWFMAGLTLIIVTKIQIQIEKKFSRFRCIILYYKYMKNLEFSTRVGTIAHR